MKCEECLPLVEDYFDGELDAETAGEMARHLSACATCASVFARVGREQELYLRYECDAHPSPAFWDNVMARAAQEDSKRRGTQSSKPIRRLRDWLAQLPGNLNAPRFSPSLTALKKLGQSATRTKRPP